MQRISQWKVWILVSHSLLGCSGALHFSQSTEGRKPTTEQNASQTAQNDTSNAAPSDSTTNSTETTPSSTPSASASQAKDEATADSKTPAVEPVSVGGAFLSLACGIDDQKADKVTVACFLKDTSGSKVTPPRNTKVTVTFEGGETEQYPVFYSMFASKRIRFTIKHGVEANFSVSLAFEAKDNSPVEAKTEIAAGPYHPSEQSAEASSSVPTPAVSHENFRFEHRMALDFNGHLGDGDYDHATCGGVEKNPSVGKDSSFVISLPADGAVLALDVKGVCGINAADHFKAPTLSRIEVIGADGSLLNTIWLAHTKSEKDSFDMTEAVRGLSVSGDITIKVIAGYYVNNGYEDWDDMYVKGFEIRSTKPFTVNQFKGATNGMKSSEIN